MPAISFSDSAIEALPLICYHLAKCDCIEFCVSGFGQAKWPVDVRTDLCVFLEQIDPLILWLEHPSQEPFTLDFYEQGIERALTFSENEGNVSAVCTSRLKWEPNPATEHVTRQALLQMLRQLLRTFYEVASQDAREYRPWLDRWLNAIPTSW